MKLSLRSFDLSSIPVDGRSILIIGRDPIAKRALLEDIITNLGERCDYVVGMSHDEDTTKVLARHMPENKIHRDGFSESVLQNVISESEENAKAGERKRGLVVMYDCDSDEKMFKNLHTRCALLNGRNFGVNTIWTMDYCPKMSSDVRGNIDYVFVLKDTNRAHRDRLYSKFFHMLKNPDDFVRVMDGCTDNDTCLVLDNTLPTWQSDECLFWYQSKPEPSRYKRIIQVGIILGIFIAHMYYLYK